MDITPALRVTHVVSPHTSKAYSSGPVFSYKLRYIVGFWLVEMAI